MFDFELETISRWISDGGYASVALQMPEGLKIRAPEISEFIERETGAVPVIVGRPCYGACDLFDYHGWADALIHFGHSPIPSQGDDPNVLYIESRSDAEVDESIIGSLSRLPERIGLLATVQYLGLIPKVKGMLESSGREVRVGEGDRRICHPGQVLGCNCSAAESVDADVDGYLFIGEGDFHPLAAAFGMEKPVLVLNPVTGEVRDMSETRDRILRRRFAAIQGARDAESFLVIVCSKVGQNRSGLADEMVSLLRRHGRTAHKVIIEEINPTALMSYQVDAFVNTACPRIAMDDAARYPKPMLTPPELEIALGEREWGQYVFDQIRP
ncbi:MAG TPA: diphthamide biosynthesis enzyme Dph2 [Euryarchaeota archaeon]|nr:diphthamide biosynthesis enzyme Dph2 [Euryarchaeota archaeon]